MNFDTINDLEYHLLMSEHIRSKCRLDHDYRNKLYGALCNTSWSANHPIPLLKSETWSCSWRYAGDLVARLSAGEEQFDYMDFYANGSEGKVDPIIMEDLDKLGFICMSKDVDN
jgi:hypothetical protein